MIQSEQINELATALAKAQGVLEGAKKDSNNPFYKSKYADLASVWEVCRLPLSENGLSIMQGPEKREDCWVLCTLLAHISGQWVKSYCPIIFKEQGGPQAMGSAISYARRYALAAILGIYQEDADAEPAQKAYKEEENKQKYEKKPTAAKPKEEIISENKTIDDEQLKDLMIALEGKNALREKMLKHANIDHFSKLPLEVYESYYKRACEEK